MPKAWKASELAVDLSRRVETCLRISKATAPRSAPDHSERLGTSGDASSRKKA